MKKNCNYKREITLGTKVELEHKSLFPKGKQKLMAIKIAKQHIKEIPCYYSKGLIPMEKKLKKK